jgi:deoxycytidine triphosphate deaminase/cell division protein FtsL
MLTLLRILSLIGRGLARVLAGTARLKFYLSERIPLEMTTQQDEVAAQSSKYAQSEEKANELFTKFERKDPFPEIDRALLNSADVSDYVATTGMIYPFYEEKQKPASYEVAVLGKYVYWDEKDKKHVGIIKPGKEFILRRNSIAFVTLEPTFRIPEYIAFRFNLKITHIYRGILLGTGPLVDPGFTGKLSIPLHNLTTNDYTLVGGEPLIWMEFTKLSWRQEWQPTKELQNSVQRRGVFYQFPPRKKNFGDVEDYLRKADAHRSIRSSISDALQNAVKAANRAKRMNYVFTGISVLAILVASIALYSYFTNTNSYLRKSQDEVQTVRLDLEKEKKRSEELEVEIKQLNQRLEGLRVQVEELKGR